MPIRVLVVDDAPFIREILSHLIRKGSMDLCGEAVDGEDAVTKALDLRPDVIIMDIVMPKKSGIEATKEILATLPETKIIACSTEGHESMMVRAIEAGCCDFIVKPFKNEQIIRIIKHVVGKDKEHGRA